MNHYSLSLLDEPESKLILKIYFEISIRPSEIIMSTEWSYLLISDGDHYVNRVELLTVINDSGSKSQRSINASTAEESWLGRSSTTSPTSYLILFNEKTKEDDKTSTKRRKLIVRRLKLSDSKITYRRNKLELEVADILCTSSFRQDFIFSLHDWNI